MLISDKIKIFADTADIDAMRQMVEQYPFIQGWTTNPTLMRQAGVGDYAEFAAEVLRLVPDRPVSFEVLSDDHREMVAQAREIASWGDNVYVKIPVTNSRGEFSSAVISELTADGIKLNVTAVFTMRQVRHVVEALGYSTAPAVISVFAGRIADTGRDPVAILRNCWPLLRHRAELLWASPRQVRDLFLAEEARCDIITMTPALLGKLDLIGRDLEDYSRETAAMFHRDAAAAGYTIGTRARARTTRRKSVSGVDGGAGVDVSLGS